VYLCGGALGAPACRSSPAADRRSPGGIDKAIERTISKFSFDGTFSQCLVNLGKLANVPIVGDWTTLKVVGVTPETRVAFSVSNVRISQALDVAIAKATPKDMHLGWTIDAAIGGIRVTTQRAALSGRRSVGVPTRRAAPAPGIGQGLTFNETPLAQVVQTFRELTRLNFHVNWRALAEINVDRDTPVTLAVSGVSLGRALDLVTDELSDNLDKFQRAYWIYDRGIIKISTGTALNTGLRTQVLDVSTLLMPAVDVKMPRRIGLRGISDSNVNDRRYDNSRGRSGGTGRTRDGGRQIGRVNAGVGLIVGGQDQRGPDAEEQAEKIRENVIGMIKDSIGEDMWEPSGKGSIRILGNRLVISQTLLGYKLMNDSLRSRRR